MDDATFAERMSRAHRTLAAHLDDLRQMTAGAGPEGVPGLSARLQAARALLVEHFRLEEQNGYMGEVLHLRPHLTREVEELHRQHDQILGTLDALIASAEPGGASGGPCGVPPNESGGDEASRVGERLQDWLSRVRGHESRENALVQEAFNREVVAED